MAEKKQTAVRQIQSEDKHAQKKQRRKVMVGAAFLMATSAVGPGFLTQTAVFTEQLLASFGFVILITIILNLGAQMNIWRIIAVTKMRGQDISNAVFPGLGYVVSTLIVIGGLVFNIGNVAGGGLGLNALLGLSDMTGAFNGLILPLILGATLLAVFRKKIVGDFKHPPLDDCFGVAGFCINSVPGY